MKKGFAFTSALAGVIVGFIAISNLAPINNPPGGTGATGAAGPSGSPGISGSPGPQGSPGPAATPAYLVYTALLTQTGTDAPVATVRTNTLGGVPTWIYDSAGLYHMELIGAFTGAAPFAILGNTDASTATGGNGVIYVVGASTNANSYSIAASQAGALIDAVLTGVLIEVRIYPP